jgi:hypothetical protein
MLGGGHAKEIDRPEAFHLAHRYRVVDGNEFNLSLRRRFLAEKIEDRPSPQLTTKLMPSRNPDSDFACCATRRISSIAK